MLNNFASTQAGGTGTVTTTTILDSTIANADVASDAAIDSSKIEFGGVSIGSGYSDTTPPTNGLLVEANVGVGQTTPQSDNSSTHFVHIGDSSGASAGLVLEDGENQWEIWNNGWLVIKDGTETLAYWKNTGNKELVLNTSLFLEEKSAADSDIAAYGQIWVKDGTPNSLYFTDDAGTDTKVTTDTTYTAGDGLDLSGTAFSTDLKSNGGLEIQSTELSVAQGISQYDVAQFVASVVDNDFLRVDSTSVEGRSASEVLSDIAALGTAGGTMSGAIACADQVVGRSRFTDYAETINAIGATGGGIQDIDVESGNVVSATVDTNANTFTFSNPSAIGNPVHSPCFLPTVDHKL